MDLRHPECKKPFRGPLLTHHTSNHMSSSLLLLINIRVFLIVSLTFPIVMAVGGERGVEVKVLSAIYSDI